MIVIWGDVMLFSFSYIHFLATRSSAEVIIGMMNSVFPFLNFTIEVGEDFVNGKLPSLDIEVWVQDG